MCDRSLVYLMQMNICTELARKIMRSEDARKEHSQHTADNGIISDEWNEITREEQEKKMIYGVRDDPPVYTCAVYGLQVRTLLRITNTALLDEQRLTR